MPMSVIPKCKSTTFLQAARPVQSSGANITCDMATIYCERDPAQQVQLTVGFEYLYEVPLNLRKHYDAVDNLTNIHVNLFNMDDPEENKR